MFEDQALRWSGKDGVGWQEVRISGGQRISGEQAVRILEYPEVRISGGQRIYGERIVRILLYCLGARMPGSKISGGQDGFLLKSVYPKIMIF